ncbi:LysR substrate-binding domain-containing protein [Aeromonas jandaei]|jgi:DNA-binding transcriptional LysR family regulator|uniref:LysR family transcriptional regulator n=1 Tax=Aeromonas TaxID=642 RepID=UPI000D390050|nr:MULTISPECIES: LysR family transcriptional regulator [Aeromonas]MBL0628217.1 LysR family transcriptional regulator [Aeromonas jandaei]MVG16680.1 LysR family transcriptional regulator [Aeromonas jandaei]PTT47556.1 LysR family transcriptional regulator [Aeromonas sp. HMWF016]QSR71876.1 LysR family transcriptional regulator [Aeromonas jandaei]RQM73959.1 LysR family transcriptional regulator [Aeromonas jandaei]
MDSSLSRLDLNLLAVFDMLMQERNVTRAAERLHLSQSTVSHALGRLRIALDDPLFVMSRREMMPTERAKALAGPVRQALAMLEQGLRQAKGFEPASARRIFRIATPGSVEHGLVPLLVDRLFRAAPHCRLEVCELADSDYERELEKGELDLVIGFAGANHLSPRLWREEWFSNPLVCLSPLGSELPDVLTPVELVSRPHIHTSSWGHSQAMVELWLARFGVERELGVRLPSFMAVPPLMATGRYLVVVPEMIGRHFCRYYPLRMHQLDPEIPIVYLMAGHPLTAHDEAISWFKSLLHQLVYDLYGADALGTPTQRMLAK